MIRTMRALLVVVALAFLTTPRAQAGNKVKGTVKESGRTAGHAVRDGVLTFGRSTRAFFTGGPQAAKRTWKANAARTKANAHTGKARVKAAAHD